MKCWAGLLLFVAACGAQAGGFNDFGPDSRAAIERAHPGKPFILALWALDCAYCREDLDMLGALVRQRPDISLVTVCTDCREAGGEGAALLEAARLPRHERWQFAATDVDRLRYAIDPRWYGEVPRTYFYDAAHAVHALSGRPTQAWLDRWLRGLR
jgi:hypothetical protein